jgi:hypothetical protein
MEVKNIGEIIISFAELQHNKYWKYYYDLSLMLTNDDDKNMVIQYHKYGSEYHNKQIYNEPRFWSFNTAYIETSMITKETIIKNNGDICYYKINPYDLVNMKYSSKEEYDIFNMKYITTIPGIKNNIFDKISIIYNNIAIDYHLSSIEKEIKELSVIFEDKKNIINLLAFYDKEGMNYDILMIIYNKLVSSEGNLKYLPYIDIVNTCIHQNRLDHMIQIMAVTN